MTKVGTLQNAESEFPLQRSMWPVPTTKRLLDTGADDARDDHETKQRKDDTVPMTQEPSSGPGVERSRLHEERRAAKRALGTPEEMDTMLVAAEAVLTATRATVEALTVSVLQQAYEMSHRAETTAEISSKLTRT